MTLCLISATDSCNVTLARKSGLASPLESALAKNASASPLESALAKSLDLKSPEINTYRKCGGVPSLPFTIFVCESVFIGVFICGYISWLFCLPPLLPLLPLQAMAADWPGATVGAGWGRQRGLGGDAANRDEAPGGWGRSSVPSSVRYNVLGDARSEEHTS